VSHRINGFSNVFLRVESADAQANRSFRKSSNGPMSRRGTVKTWTTQNLEFSFKAKGNL
jgi:hypothetical protein